MTVGACNKCGLDAELPLAGFVCQRCSDRLDKLWAESLASDWVIISVSEVLDIMGALKASLARKRKGFEEKDIPAQLPGCYYRYLIRNTTFGEMKSHWATDGSVDGFQIGEASVEDISLLRSLSDDIHQPAAKSIIRPATQDEIDEHDAKTISETLLIPEGVVDKDERLRLEATTLEPTRIAGEPMRPVFGESGNENETYAHYERRLCRYSKVRVAWVREKALAEFKAAQIAEPHATPEDADRQRQWTVKSVWPGLESFPGFSESGYEDETYGEYEQRLLRYEDARDAWAREQALAEFKSAPPLAMAGAATRIVDQEPTINPKRGLSQVAGMADLKEQLMHEVIGPFKDPALYRRYRVSLPNGILFYGPPGCGKTYLARSLADELGWSFQYCRPSEVASPYIHDTVSKIRQMFADAIEKAPSVVFIDEFEAFVPARSQLGGHQQYKAEEVNEFLSNLEGCAERKVLVIAATNEPEKIDPAVRRSGRFDKLILIPPPDAEARKAMLEFHLSDRPMEAELDTAGVAAILEGYSASDVKLLVDEAARMALKRFGLISTTTLLAVLEQVPPSITRDDVERYSAFRSRGV